MVNTDLYFHNRDLNIYYITISDMAITIIKEKPKNWEDKLFREVFRNQRKYINDLWNINVNTELARYVEKIETDELAVTYLNNLILQLSSRIKEAGGKFQEAWGYYLDARGRDAPGDSYLIVDAARVIFADYIFLLEMRYDVEFLVLPQSDASQRVRAWIQNTIQYLVSTVYDDFFDRIDYVADSLAEGRNEDLSGILVCDYNINIDVNEVIADFALMGIEALATKKLIHRLN